MMRICFVLLGIYVYVQAERQKKIIFGTHIGNVVMKELYPFMARIVMDGAYRCGGSVISERQDIQLVEPVFRKLIFVIQDNCDQFALPRKMPVL